MTTPYFFLTAAEHSGDRLGAKLIGALKRRYPEARFAGVGGAEMEAAGCELLANPVKGSAMLAKAFFTHGWYWWKLLRQIRRKLDGRGKVAAKPDVVIPIDSSVTNLRIAAAAKQAGLKVCYFVAPQIWASRPWRIKKVQGVVDTLCCMLPFEEKYFTERGVKAVYVGHPMFDEPVAGDGAVAEPPDGGTRSSGPNIAMFPGSRKAEIDWNMPAMLKVIGQIKGRHARATFVVAAPSEERAWQLRHHLRTANAPVEIRIGNAEAVIARADLVLCKSGTTTLQVARQGKPMVVVFAVPWLHWLVAKRFLTTPYVTLVNILAGREIVKEFIPFPRNAMVVTRECLELLAHEGLRVRMEEELRAVVATLQPREGMSATERVADEVAKLLGGKAGSLGAQDAAETVGKQADG